MNLKLGIILQRKPDVKNIDSIIAEILLPYLSSTPKREIVLKNCNKEDMKEKYKLYKEENYRGVSPKKRKEDMINKGIDTFDGFCKNIHGIIKFSKDKEAIISFNPVAFIDEYNMNSLKRINELDEEELSLILDSIIDKELNVHHRELQLYKKTPSVVIKPILEQLKKTDYIILIDYIF